jgi:hypothetical protein
MICMLQALAALVFILSYNCHLSLPTAAGRLSGLRKCDKQAGRKWQLIVVR